MFTIELIYYSYYRQDLEDHYQTLELKVSNKGDFKTFSFLLHH